MAMNDIITLHIESLTHDGRGLARAHGDTLPTSGSDAAGGRTSGRTRNRGTVVFVTGGLPGQTVRARLTRRKSSFYEAEVQEILQEAPRAVPPVCAHHGDCGGCPLQTMPYDTQLQWKRRIALDAMIRIGGLDAELVENLCTTVLPSPALEQYRNKVELAFAGSSTEDDPLILGLRRRNGRGVVSVPQCAQLPAAARGIVHMAADLAAQSGLAAHTPRDQARYRQSPQEDKAHHGNTRANTKSRHAVRAGRRTPGNSIAAAFLAAETAQTNGFWRFLVLRRGLAADLRTPGWWALCITSPGSPEEQETVRAMGQKLIQSFPALAGFIHEERTSEDALAQGQKRITSLDRTGAHNPSSARFWLPLGGRHFALDAASFFQVNTAAAQVLADTAIDMLKRHVSQESPALLDLYCGVGAPGLLMAEHCGRLLGLEQDARAVALAQANAAAMGFTHCSYVAGDAAQRLDKLAPTHENYWHPSETWDVVLADPPRAGLAPRALNALLRLNAHTLLYVSCNPATLARDAARLRETYRLVEMAAVDLFPHTPHVECITLWQSL